MRNIAQLEADLRTKTAALKEKFEGTMRAAQAHVVKPATADAPAITGREFTDEEKASLQAQMDECKAIDTQLQRARGDSAMGEAIDRMLAGQGTAVTGGSNHPARRESRSIGAQLVQDPAFRAFIAAGGHRKTVWQSPTVEGFLMATTLTSDPASGGALILPDNRPGLVPLLFARPVVADLVAPGSTTSNLVQYMKEKTFTNAADTVLEGADKPESTLIFEMASAAVRKIAHWIPVTEEMLDDAAQTQSVVDARLQLGIALTEEDQLLNGSGVAPDLLGFNKLPGLAPTVSVTTGVGAVSAMDAIFMQISAIATTAFLMPDGFVMNPADWMPIVLSKDNTGRYLGAGPFASAQAPSLWGITGVVTPAQTAGLGLVGAFRQASQIFRRSGVSIEASNSHADFFIKNLVAIRGEERLALAVYREGAFGKVDFVAGP
jgi:HK97 family phage major capsid protein